MTKWIDKVRNYAYKMMNGDQTGHGFDHVQRVVNNVQKILQNETANAELVLTAAYLHDVFDDKLTDEVAGRKADVRRQLIAFGYDTAEINEIFYIIEHICRFRQIWNNITRYQLKDKLCKMLID